MVSSRPKTTITLFSMIVYVRPTKYAYWCGPTRSIQLS